MDFNINFEMTELERQHGCLKTIINMLIARKWLDDDFDKYYALLLSTNTKDFIDMVNIKCVIDKKVAIKFYNYKLNTFKNDKEIDTFISTYPDYHKILIVSDISTKAEKQLIGSIDFEVFKQMEIIKDISKHHLVPKHILLSKEDTAKVMSEYKIKKKDMARIYIDDPMARYLYAQKDDIIQIIRESVNCGYSTFYRLVVLGSINN
jgi:DNA-directed RNA polymerase subunit H (RpoH/RPB5)